MTDAARAEVIGLLKQLLAIVSEAVDHPDGEPLAERLSTHLGRAAHEVAVVTEQVPAHRYVDLDIALELIAARDHDAAVVGVGGNDMRHHLELADMVRPSFHSAAFTVGPADLANLPTGPHSDRTCLAFGFRLFRYEGLPMAVLLRQPNPRYGREGATLDVLCAEREASQRLLAELRELSIRHSVLRGQVVSLAFSGYEATANGVTFLERPQVDAAQVILPPGVLDRVQQHVVGVAEHADELRAYRQHLKRGLLLYGPPGSGKTHTVRHMMSVTPGHTVVVLAGETLRFIGLAASVARALQPAIVVLEDCDLIAADRDLMGNFKPLLFEVLDAMDGLDADADVTFLLTTNRVDEMERALTQRPGRIDLAVEVPLPDLDGRRRLMRLYSPAPDTFSLKAIELAASRTEGTAASFARELVRRAILAATLAGEPPADAHLSRATEELLSASETLTRVMLGEAPSSHGGFEVRPRVAGAREAQG